LLKAIEKVGSLRIPASASCGRGEDHHGRESCRGARHEGPQDTPIDLARSQRQYLVPGPRHDRSVYDAIADLAGELARIIQQPRDASEPVRRTREDRRLAKLEAR